MPSSTGTNYQALSDILFTTTIVFAVLVLIQLLLFVILRAKLNKKNKETDDSTKMMSFAGFALLAAGFPTIWLILSIALAIVYCVLTVCIISTLMQLLAPKAQPKPEPEPEPAPLPEPEPVMDHAQEEAMVAAMVRESITIEEAHDALTDEIASHFVEVEDSDEDKRYHNKTIINIDTLSKNYASGETVNLASLKEKNLLPNKADFVKVLARGMLDKQLTVEVQDFSVDAVKMIILTGGKAIQKK